MPTKAVAPGITRFDFEDRQGFMVRIRRKGKQVNEFYSAKRYGGLRKALTAAKDRYDELCKKLGPVVNRTKNALSERNSTGKVGVHVAYSHDSRWPDCEYWAFCASWLHDGQRKKISFAWRKYGEDLAWELACFARDKKISDRARVVTLFERAQEKDKAKRKAKRSAK